MSTSVSSDLYSSIGLDAATAAAAGKTKKKKDTLDQADFLKLMTTQLQHQDPLKPMDNNQMVAQMAQLSTVQGINDLNGTVKGLQTSMSSDKILRGAAMVGRDVLVPSGKFTLETAGAAEGSVVAPSAGQVTVDITDATGVKIKQVTVPATAAGEVAFQWDGTGPDGKRMPPGSYTITANHADSAGKQTKLRTYTQASVDSVTVGSDGLYLNLKGLGTVPLDFVLRVS